MIGKLRWVTATEKDRANFLWWRTVNDWIFKFVGWVVIVGTMRYARLKTGSPYFQVAELVLFAPVWMYAFAAVRRLGRPEFDPSWINSRPKKALEWAVRLIVALVLSQLAIHAVTDGIDAIAHLQLDRETQSPEPLKQG